VVLKSTKGLTLTDMRIERFGNRVDWIQKTETTMHQMKNKIPSRVSEV